MISTIALATAATFAALAAFAACAAFVDFGGAAAFAAFIAFIAMARDRLLLQAADLFGVAVTFPHGETPFYAKRIMAFAIRQSQWRQVHQLLNLLTDDFMSANGYGTLLRIVHPQH